MKGGLREKRNFKPDVRLLFHVTAFLFITIFFILPYLVQISTYFHEKGHQAALNTHSIKNSYTLNLLETIPSFWNPHTNKLGVTRFDLDQYFTLDKEARAEIHFAGIISDLRFLFLIAVYLALVNVYTFYKIRYKHDYDLTGILAINWLLFMWLLALIQITIANISYAQGDVYQLLRYLRL